jgi:acyl-CoA synthetase (AMP-forming)/AMP-acid ligase II
MNGAAHPRVGGNVCELLLRAAAGPERPAIVDGSTTTSYGELAARALAFGERISAAGVAPGDRVGIWLRRNADAAAAFFGTLACGGVAVQLNELLRPRQLDYALGHSGASLLVTSMDLRKALPRPLETSAASLDVGSVPAEASFDPVPRAESDIAQIVYTSGSTGPPKGIVVSHGNLLAGADSVVSYLGISSNDRIASLLPFSFDYGMNQLMCAVACAAPLVIERSPVAVRIVTALRDRKVTVAAGVPPLWLQLLGVDAFRAEPIPSLRVMTNSGGRVPTSAVRELRRCQPQADLVLMYGLTEAFRSTYLRPERVDRKPTSIGQAIPGAQVQVVGADGTPCQPGEVGELIHRGPTVTLGYWEEPGASARVFRPDPLRRATPDAERVVFSGDLAYADDEGDLYFVGRNDAMIKTLGYRVSPDEVVDVLHASGQVVEAVVSSEPDEIRGQRIVAHVVLTDQGSVDDLKRFSSRELPRYMQPSRIEVRSELPRTATGKHDITGLAGTEG